MCLCIFVCDRIHYENSFKTCTRTSLNTKSTFTHASIVTDLHVERDARMTEPRKMFRDIFFFFLSNCDGRRYISTIIKILLPTKYVFFCEFFTFLCFYIYFLPHSLGLNQTGLTGREFKKKKLHRHLFSALTTSTISLKVGNNKFVIYTPSVSYICTRKNAHMSVYVQQ